MRTIFKTEHGSTYELDFDKKTWFQLSAGEDKDEAFALRTLSGPFDSIGEIKIGGRVNILCPPLTPGTSLRLITTSPAVSIEQVD